jgi:hypothetical protein
MLVKSRAMTEDLFDRDHVGPVTIASQQRVQCRRQVSRQRIRQRQLPLLDQSQHRRRHIRLGVARNAHRLLGAQWHTTRRIRHPGGYAPTPTVGTRLHGNDEARHARARRDDAVGESLQGGSDAVRRDGHRRLRHHGLQERGHEQDIWHEREHE